MSAMACVFSDTVWYGRGINKRVKILNLFRTSDINFGHELTVFLVEIEDYGKFAKYAHSSRPTSDERFSDQ